MFLKINTPFLIFSGSVKMETIFWWILFLFVSFWTCFWGEHELSSLDAKQLNCWKRLSKTHTTSNLRKNSKNWKQIKKLNFDKTKMKKAWHKTEKEDNLLQLNRKNTKQIKLSSKTAKLAKIRKRQKWRIGKVTKQKLIGAPNIVEMWLKKSEKKLGTRGLNELQKHPRSFSLKLYLHHDLSETI